MNLTATVVTKQKGGDCGMWPVTGRRKYRLWRVSSKTEAVYGNAARVANNKQSCTFTITERLWVVKLKTTRILNRTRSETEAFLENPKENIKEGEVWNESPAIDPNVHKCHIINLFRLKEVISRWDSLQRLKDKRAERNPIKLNVQTITKSAQIKITIRLSEVSFIWKPAVP